LVYKIRNKNTLISVDRPFISGEVRHKASSTASWRLLS